MEAAPVIPFDTDPRMAKFQPVIADLNTCSDEEIQRRYGMTRKELKWDIDQWRESLDGFDEMDRMDRLVEAEERLTPIIAPSGYVKKPIPAKLRWAVFKRDSYCCVVCSSDVDLAADHIHAEVRGGEATLENLQTLCRRCNSKKGAR